LVAANLAALMATFYAYNVAVGASTSTEIPSIILILLTILFLSSWLSEGRLAYSVFAGASLGLAILDRPAAVVFLPFGMMLHCWKPASIPRLLRFSGCILFFVAAAALFLPWSVRTSRVAGTLCVVTSGGAWNLWFGNNPWMADHLIGKIPDEEIAHRLRAVIPGDGASQAQQDKAAMSAMWEFIRAHPRSELQLLALKTVKFWEIPGTTAIAVDRVAKSLRWVILLMGCVNYLPIALLSLLSVIFYVRSGQTNEIALYLAWIALTFVSYVWFPAVTRFRFAGGLDNLMIVMSAAFLGAAVFSQGVRGGSRNEEKEFCDPSQE
jgi:4-amino-4-deoxy-L-arabinose transferase-like glycosyltransferase